MTVRAKITNLSHEGRGIAQIDGKTTFVLGALPNEDVELTYLKKHRQYDEAKATTIHEASIYRTKPRCDYFLTCGGCSLQHLVPEQQILWKQKVLLEQLQHFAGIAPKELLPPLTAQSWNYRYKARLGVKYLTSKQKLVLGFRELNGRFITDMSNCDVLHPVIAKNFVSLREMLATLEIKCFVPQIEVACSDDTCCLIIRHLKPFSELDLEKVKTFAEQTKIHIYLQAGGLDSITRFWPAVSEEKNYLSYQLSDYQLKLYFEPHQFTQINPYINRKMIQQAIKLLQPEKNDIILDLFCGIGNFTLPFSQFSKHIVGVEGSQSAIEMARYNARQNHISNAEFFCADLTKRFEIQPWAKYSYNKIILDPPRSGAEEIVSQITRWRADSILYISCNPATLARDTKILIEQGYVLKKAGVMDMFPHTSHVEAMALLTR